MPIAKHIISQIRDLTADLIELGLCDKQNYPALRDFGSGKSEIGISNKTNFSFALRNISYQNIYDELDRTETYNFRMLDGALVQIMYRFTDDEIEEHRLAFFPSPYLEQFQNNPEIYSDDEMYAEVTMRNIVPLPLRFDFISREGEYEELRHPKSHLTLGQYKNCRIPVCAPLTPYHFVSFILRNFYHTAYTKYGDSIRPHSHCFTETIFTSERAILHIRIPVSSLE
jgi:hypothetical protein